MDFLFVLVHTYVWSTLLQIHFVLLLEYEGFSENTLRCSLCPHWHRVGLVTYVEILFMPSLAYDGFG